MDARDLLAESIGEEEARILMAHLWAEDFRPGHTLFMEGVPANDLYYLVSGSLTVTVQTAGGDVSLGLVRPGAWIGEIGFIDGGAATATVKSAETSRVLRISHDGLMTLQAKHPHAAAVLMRTVTAQLAQRLVSSTAGIVEQITEGRYRLKRPEETRSWLSRALGSLFGGAR